MRRRSAVGAALDGAEMVMRGELVSGNAGQLPALMPSFVFLVALPVVTEDEALDLSKRMARLVEGRWGISGAPAESAAQRGVRKRAHKGGETPYMGCVLRTS